MKVNIKKLAYKLGYKISKINRFSILDEDPLIAIKDKIQTKEIILFDIGANKGQTVEKMKMKFPNAIIHTFEPSNTSYNKLKLKFQGKKEINLYNIAIGSEKGKLKFNQYNWSAMDSLLKRSYGTAKIIDNYLVNVTTVDDFCLENAIPYINLLKTDTEGYELNVLKGATKTFDENRIQFVLIEIFFNENYIDQGSFGDIYNYLLSKNFNLVRFYDVIYTNDGLASKTDALFICNNFSQKDLKNE